MLHVQLINNLYGEIVWLQSLRFIFLLAMGEEWKTTKQLQLSKILPSEHPKKFWNSCIVHVPKDVFMNHVPAFKMHYFELTHAAITQVDITDGQDDKYNSNEDYYGETGNFDRLICRYLSYYL